MFLFISLTSPCPSISLTSYKIHTCFAGKSTTKKNRKNASKYLEPPLTWLCANLTTPTHQRWMCHLQKEPGDGSGCWLCSRETHAVHSRIRPWQLMLVVWLYICLKIAKLNMRYPLWNCSDLHKTFMANFTLLGLWVRLMNNYHKGLLLCIYRKPLYNQKHACPANSCEDLRKFSMFPRN